MTYHTVSAPIIISASAVKGSIGGNELILNIRNFNLSAELTITAANQPCEISFKNET